MARLLFLLFVFDTSKNVLQKYNFFLKYANIFHFSADLCQIICIYQIFFVILQANTCEMYKQEDKICDLIASSTEALQIASRFGLPLGVEDKTVEEVCRENGIHPDTFLAVINHQSSSCVQSESLMVYLKNAHRYFIDYQLPKIRQELIEAISSVQTGSQIPLLIIRFYDEYVEEVKTHIQHENAKEFQLHADDDEHIAKKLEELKSLIIKYYPATAINNLLYAALQDIYQIEQELALHCSIEDDILLPALEKERAEKGDTKLSDREKDVLIELVHGLSNKEIADRLNISTHTVISHRKNIMQKLNIHSPAGLTIYAIVNQLVTIDS